jgi:hypothetical protein
MSNNVDHESLPWNALSPPEHIDAALVEVRAGLGQLAKDLNVAEEVPMLLFETQMQQQQQ